MASTLVDQKLTLPSNGQTINYVKVGSGPNVTLLLPGALGTIRSDFATLLDSDGGINSKGKMTLVAWDPPGYGASRPPERTWPQNYFTRDAACAVEFMRELGHERFNAVGWSDGGITGLCAAAANPDAVSKLVIWGAQGHITEHDMKMLDGVSNVENWSERMRKPMEEIYGVEGFPKLWAAFNKAFGDILRDLGGKICDLGAVECPTLVVHGDKDAMVDPIHPDHLEKNIKNARYSSTHSFCMR